MRIAILAIGQRGDVQPLVALGIELQRRGHQVRFTAPDDFTDMVGQSPMVPVPLGISLRDTAAAYRDVPTLVRALRPRILATLSERTDAIIGTYLALSAGTYARAISVPFIYTAFSPSLPTRAFAHPSYRPLRLGGLYNLLTYRQARRSSQLANPDAGCLEQQPYPIQLYAFSSAVVSRPPEWPAHAHVTGYWFLDTPAEYTPPAALQCFLAGGSPPVVVGFGSSYQSEPLLTARLVLDALSQAGQRAILLTGAGQEVAAASSDRVFVTREVPFDWLFPRCAAVVHHAGAGTTAQALRSGLPSVAVPFGMDQPFWARRLVSLGASPAPLARQRLTSERLAAAIRRAVDDAGYRANAEAVGRILRTENGAQTAANLIESQLA
ncbi:MAG: glycosyltransferase family 1 protein [Chloroflexi bacterium]|nr:glycosyltransferase family 1 protein [Chloroflexota bacterium]